MFDQCLRLRGAVLVVALISTPILAQEGGGNEIDRARESIGKWVETQRIIAKERQEWQTGREVLQQRIELLQTELRTIEEKIAETREGLAEARTKQAELDRERDELERASRSLREVIGTLESRTDALVRSLPDPIKEKVGILAQRIPKDPGTADLSLSQRFSTVIGILNEVNKFSLNVDVRSELRTLPDGTTAEVTALYVGMGQAYYVSADGRVAGIGLPGPDGWEWTPNDDIAPQVTQALAVLNDEQVPAYVPLPVTIEGEQP